MTVLYTLSWQAAAQTVAVTFDDGFDPRGEPRAAQWNAHMLDTLARHRVRAMLFPAGFMVDSPEGLALVRAWGEAGHAIGNHTYTHKGYVDGVTPEAFLQDVLRDEALLDAMPGWCRRVRLPFLEEGKTPERHDAILALLARHGYALAPVTITIDDWNYSEQFMAAANANPALDISGYRTRYLDRLWQEAEKQESLWKQRLGRSPSHVLLLHANGLNATLLPDILSMFEARGWTFTDPLAALQDPIYARGYTADGVKMGVPTPPCR